MQITKEMVLEMLGRNWKYIAVGMGALILGLIASPSCRAGEQEYGRGGSPSATSSSRATSSSSSRSVSGAAASVGAVSGGSVTTGPVNAGGSQSSIDTHAYGFGAPSVGNGALTCEVTIPIIGGSGFVERSECATIRDARAIFDLVPAADERDSAVKNRLCGSEKIAEAFAITKRPCPKKE